MIWLLASAWAASLSLPDVLSVLDARHPKMAAIDAKVDEAEAGVLSSRGAFDPTFIGKAATYGGKYERNVVDLKVHSDTLFGPSVSVGYTRGTGDIPEYAGDTKTGASGELVGQLDVPLLKGLGVGKDRMKLLSSKAKLQAVQAGVDDARRMLQQDAAVAYWTWVAAGMSVRVERDQLSLAERRATALGRQVEEGSRAPIDKMDNERVLADRQASVAMAEQKLEVSAQKLSLYIRTPDGRPRVPTPSELPDAWPDVPTVDSVDEQQVLERRPDLRVVELMLDVANLERRQAGNLRLPELVVTAKGIHPLDADLKQEVVGGIALKAPLALRDGRGQHAAMVARVSAAQSMQRLAQDEVRAEVAGALASFVRSLEARAAARLSATRATEVLALERRRVELGASDLFKLLLREEYLTKAREKAVKAEWAVRVANVSLRTAQAVPLLP